MEFQDIRFNCYADSEFRDGGGKSDTSSRDNRDQLYHKNILIGHSSIIQSKSSITQHGGLLILVSQNYENPESQINFFEPRYPYPSQPKGILLQNHQITTPEEINVTNIGLGSLTEPYSRVKIRGRTADNTMNALKVVDWNDEPLFTVCNDGYISIGSKTYTEDLPQEIDYRLSVEGQIVAKDIIVTLEDWSDFVFEEGYKLKPLEELEKFIKENKQLPGMPSTEEVIETGVNLGKMQVKLLQKIEELTLYVIELKKENDILKEKFNKIEINKVRIK